MAIELPQHAITDDYVAGDKRLPRYPPGVIRKDPASHRRLRLNQHESVPSAVVEIPQW